MLRSLIVLVVFSQLAVADTKPFKDLTADDKDRVMAARLLFGVLDEAKLRHFIVAYYRDALRVWQSPARSRTLR